MSRRAALLQCPGDPFVLAYWCRNFQKVWRAEVDELHVFINGCESRRVLEIDERLVEFVGGRLRYQPGRLVHGDAARMLLADCDADDVMLIEDDAYVRFYGEVDRHFRLGIVGSPRGGMSPEVEQAAREQWGPDPIGPDGSSGYGLWPCFLLAPREVLDGVVHGFSSKAYALGGRVPGLERSFERTVTTDTFTAAAFMLRAGGYEIAYEGQWKELWLRDLDVARARASYEPPWYHFGGLSTQEFWQGGDAHGARPKLAGSNEGNDWAHRIWGWRRCVMAHSALDPDLAARYHRALDDLTESMGVHDEVRAWDSETEWITWDDGL